MSFRKSFFKNLLVSGGYIYLSQIVNFFASFITSRLLLPSDFGLVGLITVFSGFITVFSDSGITQAVIRTRYENTYYRGINSISVIIGITLCTIMLMLIYPISLFYKNAQILWPGVAISFLFIIRSLSIVPVAVLQKKLHFSTVGKIIFFSTVAQTLSTILFAWLGLKFWALIWAQYVQAGVMLVLAYNKTIENLFTLRKPIIAKSFHLTKNLIGSLIGFNVINYWARNTDNLIVGKYYKTNDLGIYNRAYLMLQLPLNLITGLFNSVLFPNLVKRKNEGGDVQSEYYFILKIISVINIPIAFILILFPYAFTTVLWGKSWLDVAKLLPYFGLLNLTQTLTSTIGNLMIIENKEKAMMYTGWLNAAFIIGGIIYGSTISITAIAAYTALCYILLVLPVNIFYMMGYKLHYTSHLLSFWLPKLFLSLFIWIGLYFSSSKIVIGGFLLWILIVLWDTRKEIFSITGFILSKSTQKFLGNV